MAYTPAQFEEESPEVDVYAREPVQANYIAPPDADTQWRPGTQPLDTLPTQWWNYFNNMYTKRMNVTAKYVKQLVSEVAAIAGTPDGTDSLQMREAIVGRIEALKDYVDEQLEENATDTTTVPALVQTTGATGTSQHGAPIDHVHGIADGAVTRTKIAAGNITGDRFNKASPGDSTSTAVAVAQAYNAALATKLANAGIVSVQTSIPSSATNEAAHCVPNVDAVREFVKSKIFGYSVDLVVPYYSTMTYDLREGVMLFVFEKTPGGRILIDVTGHIGSVLHIGIIATVMYVRNYNVTTSPQRFQITADASDTVIIAAL